MTQEKWLVDDEKVIDFETVRSLKVSLVGGKVDIVGHDEPGARVEIHSVRGKQLKVTLDGDRLEIDHPQLSWENFLDVFTSFTGRASADISIMVPRDVVLKLGIVSASALISGLRNGGTLSTVSGDIVVDDTEGDIQLNSVSGEIAVRDHDGQVGARTVSGDITVSGEIDKFTGETVSGSVFLDIEGTPDAAKVSTVSGTIAVRLEPGVAARYTINTVSGKLQLDDAQIRGVNGNYTATHGELDKHWFDFRANSVGGTVSVLHTVRGVTPVFAHGHLRLYLLSLLAERPMHGYDLIHELGDRFGGTYIPSAGTIYPRLGKLEEEGLVTKSTDGRKTVYEITDAGRAELDTRRSELDGIENDVTDSVRRLADEVRSSVNDAMKTLRADLAAAAREATQDARRGGRSMKAQPQHVAVSNQLHEAELIINDFRHQLRADLRTMAAKGELPEGTPELLRSQLASVRAAISSLSS